MTLHEPDDRDQLPASGLGTLPRPDAGPLAQPPRTDLVIVGGVPGAGKSTAIAQAARGLDHVVAIDPEQVSGWLRGRLPQSVPYRRYRWVVHSVHTARIVARLLAGPVPGRRLVIHDPGTRIRRRLLLLALARRAGWRVTELYVDVDRAAAREGQQRRGRVVGSFEQHWQSWLRLRPALIGQPCDAGRVRPLGSVMLVDRSHAADVLRRLCG